MLRQFFSSPVRKFSISHVIVSFLVALAIIFFLDKIVQSPSICKECVSFMHLNFYLKIL